MLMSSRASWPNQCYIVVACFRGEFSDISFIRSVYEIVHYHRVETNERNRKEEFANFACELLARIKKTNFQGMSKLLLLCPHNLFQIYIHRSISKWYIFLWLWILFFSCMPWGLPQTHTIWIPGTSETQFWIVFGTRGILIYIY